MCIILFIQNVSINKMATLSQSVCECVCFCVSSTNGGRCTFVAITHEWLKSCTKAFQRNTLLTDPVL